MPADTKKNFAIQVSRLSYRLSTKIVGEEDPALRDQLASAQALLTQSLVMLQTDEREARRLFSLARRINAGN